MLAFDVLYVETATQPYNFTSLFFAILRQTRENALFQVRLGKRLLSIRMARIHAQLTSKNTHRTKQDAASSGAKPPKKPIPTFCRSPAAPGLASPLVTLPCWSVFDMYTHFADDILLRSSWLLSAGSAKRPHLGQGMVPLIHGFTPNVGVHVGARFDSRFLRQYLVC